MHAEGWCDGAQPHVANYEKVPATVKITWLDANGERVSQETITLAPGMAVPEVGTVNGAASARWNGTFPNGRATKGSVSCPTVPTTTTTTTTTTVVVTVPPTVPPTVPSTPPITSGPWNPVPATVPTATTAPTTLPFTDTSTLLPVGALGFVLALAGLAIRFGLKRSFKRSVRA